MSDYISIDLMKKILGHLPAESLIRFRRVCQWMNQFIDEAFIQGRLDLQKPRFIAVYRGREVCVFNPHSSSIYASLLARRSGSEPINLVGTHRGIVCFYYYKRHFLLCNLLIRKSLIVTLPDTVHHCLDGDNSDVSDDVHSKEYGSGVCSGLLVDPKTMAFKIVVFRLLEPCTRHMEAILYSSIEQEWVSLDNRKIRMNPTLSEAPAVVIGEKGYWAVFGDTEHGASLVIFDFEDIEFDMYKGPDPDYKSRYPPVLSRWQETLSLVFVDEDYHCEVYFWEAEETWRRKLRFNLYASEIDRVRSIVEYEGEDADLAKELLENGRLLAAPNCADLVLCNNRPALVLQPETPDESTLFVAYDYKASLLFPQE